MEDIIKDLNHRYATKSFDAEKKVSKKDLDIILESFRLTPSSFWLQPWKLLVLEDREKRSKLVDHSWWQKQVLDSSHLLILCAYKDFSESNIDMYLEEIVKVRWAKREALSWYESMMKSFLSSMSKESKKSWEEKQIYIALWNLMTTCSVMWIDSCPMEWFDSKKYDEILWLDEKWIYSVVLLPIWYRSKDDSYSKEKKVRFWLEEVVSFI